MVPRARSTTDTSSGSIYYEDNAGIVVDFISYDIKDGSRGFIGKKNVTAYTIEEIRVMLMGICADAMLAPINGREFGPMIIGFSDMDDNEQAVTVREGETADTIDTYIHLRIPLPLNYLNHYVDADVSLSI